MLRMANADDMFIVDGPFPCFKGVKTSYSAMYHKRRCTQCRAFTRIGVLYLHSDSETNSRNHWVCESCANACVATLPPQTVCPGCLTIPMALFISPPLQDAKTGRIVSEGYRR